MKIKCIKSENGTIILIYQIAAISDPKSSHYIWTSKDIEGNTGYKLSDKEYKKLLNELDIL